MANFPRQQPLTIVPVAITDLIVTLTSPDPRGTEISAAAFRVGVLYNNGEIRYIDGDLVPYLVGGEAAALLSFLANLRGRAVAQILPAP